MLNIPQINIELFGVPSPPQLAVRIGSELVTGACLWRCRDRRSESLCLAGERPTIRDLL